MEKMETRMQQTAVEIILKEHFSRHTSHGMGDAYILFVNTVGAHSKSLNAYTTGK